MHGVWMNRPGRLYSYATPFPPPYASRHMICAMDVKTYESIGTYVVYHILVDSASAQLLVPLRRRLHRRGNLVVREAGQGAEHRVGRSTEEDGAFDTSAAREGGL